jgi:hypothetical protein
MNGVVTALLALASMALPTLASSQAVSTTGRMPVPFSVGERMVYDVRFGPMKVGTGSMEVAGIENIRGREAWHTIFKVKGGTFFYHVNDVLESWVDTRDFSSLRFEQDLEQGGRDRQRVFEIFPDRQMYRENDKPEQPSVRDPLDDGSFLYFIRTVPLVVGQTYRFERYFRPDRNPVIIRVLRRERIRVPAGTFEAIVIQPTIKTKGIFSEGGKAEIWLSDDERRIMLQMKSQLPFGSLNLYLRSHRPGNDATTAATTP